ncbi:MAG: hypothetical protein M1817_004764 [Caeruleum heppii]|nr:MAG: hypothetical protein M1817_004764 [Caeruleum heppii]
MAALHAALETLGPVDYDSIPHHDLSSFLRDTLARSATLVDSVPIASDDATPPAGRSRANTASSAVSEASEISASSARSAPPTPEHATLQKEWGKSIKLAAKDNPMGISVYKLSGKDGRGAWFARRSVHQGMGFSRWKRALEREFPESMAVAGGPGEGNIRGIGGERVLESSDVDGIGKLQAQFPGPTTPRDFVTLLITSSTALDRPQSLAPDQIDAQPPRQFVVLSKPCKHSEAPPRESFIRGNYESIEYIREVPIKKSTTPKSGRTRANSAGAEGDPPKLQKSSTFPLKLDEDRAPQGKENEVPHKAPQDNAGTGARKRGKTISFVEPASPDKDGLGDAKDDDEREMNPVEWIMVTRSDPGGSVPRWMVERGTPAGIVADAGKFLDWAGSAEHPPEDDDQIAVIPSKDPSEDPASMPRAEVSSATVPQPEIKDTPDQVGLLAGVGRSVGAGISSITPSVISSHLPGAQSTDEAQLATQPPLSLQSDGQQDEVSSTHSSVSSVASFATATSGEQSSKDSSHTSQTKSSKETSPATAQDKELHKLHSRKKALDERLARTRSNTAANKEEMNSKEATALQKAEEKHAKEVQKMEERYKKEVEKIERKREKETKKNADRLRREEEKDDKARFGREKEEMQKTIKKLTTERDELRVVVGDLQRENTALVSKLGKGAAGRAGREVLDEIQDELSRNASPSGVGLQPARKRGSSLGSDKGRAKDVGGGGTGGGVLSSRVSWRSLNGLNAEGKDKAKEG